MTQPRVSAEARQKTAALLSDLWQRNLPLIEQRMAVLERASAGPITEELRSEAANVAHKLAGSLGMFGYQQGTEIARELECLLESPARDLVRVASLTVQLRSILFPTS